MRREEGTCWGWRAGDAVREVEVDGREEEGGVGEAMEREGRGEFLVDMLERRGQGQRKEETGDEGQSWVKSLAWSS